jgi:hypothetical protein
MSNEGDPEVRPVLGGDGNCGDCRPRAGRAVQLFGLQTRTELNGLAGVVEEELADGRFRVHLLLLLHDDNDDGAEAGSISSDTDAGSATDNANVHILSDDPLPRALSSPPSAVPITEVSVLAKNLVLYPQARRLQHQDNASNPAADDTTPPPKPRFSSTTAIDNKLAGLQLQTYGGNRLTVATPLSLSRQLAGAPSGTILKLEPGVYEGPYKVRLLTTHQQDRVWSAGGGLTGASHTGSRVVATHTTCCSGAPPPFYLLLCLFCQFEQYISSLGAKADRTG